MPGTTRSKRVSSSDEPLACFYDDTLSHGRNAEGSESQVAPGLLASEERLVPSASPTADYTKYGRRQLDIGLWRRRHDRWGCEYRYIRIENQLW
jgi:hypothetical protein